MAAAVPDQVQASRLVPLARLMALLAVGIALLGTYGERWIPAGALDDATQARIGASAPPFSARTLDGTTVSLDQLRGRIVVLNFWATWCPPCRVEMPDLQAYQDEMGERVTIVGVNQQEPPEVIVPFLRQYGLTFVNVLDPSGEIAASYQVTALPTTLIVDRSGSVRDRVVGAMTRDALAARVQRLL